mmetsp:Transcript_121858/g.235044  ORF Transcript_121858/g.235044 Transcript_121858/m.235044 type:complete len:786 (+) Transcript_121858:32-2389(+)
MACFSQAPYRSFARGSHSLSAASTIMKRSFSVLQSVESAGPTRSLLLVSPGSTERDAVMTIPGVRAHEFVIDGIGITPPTPPTKAFDLVKSCEQAISVAQACDVDGVYGGFDIANLVAAACAKELGFKKQLSASAASTCFFKPAMRQLANAKGVGKPVLFAAVDARSSCIVDSVENAGISYPLFAKPACGSYGIGGRLIKTHADLIAHCSHVAKLPSAWPQLQSFFERFWVERPTSTHFEFPMILEELCGGRACTVDGFVLPDGKVRFFGITETEELPDGSGVRCYHAPMPLECNVKNSLLQATSKLVEALDYVGSAFSIEFWVGESPEDIALLEINARPSTTFRGLHLGLRDGDDLIRSALELSLNQIPAAKGESLEDASGRDWGLRASTGCAMRGYILAVPQDRIGNGSLESGQVKAKDVLDYPLASFAEAHISYPKDQILQTAGKVQPVAEVDISGASKASCDARLDLLQRALIFGQRSSKPCSIEVIDCSGKAGEGMQNVDGKATWVDYMLGCVRTWCPNSSALIRDEQLPLQLQQVYAVVEMEDQTMYISGEHGLACYDRRASKRDEVVLLPVPGNPPFVNDLIRAPHGLYLTAAASSQGDGALYLFSFEDRKFHAILDNLMYPNALVMRQAADDLSELLVVDSGRRAIDVVPLDKDGWRRADLPIRHINLKGDLNCVPDGLALDRLGNIWVTEWHGGRVSCWSESGELLDFVNLPVRYVTSCCFTGNHRDVLVVTTSSVPWDDEVGRAVQPPGRDAAVDMLGGGATFAIRFNQGASSSM